MVKVLNDYEDFLLWLAGRLDRARGYVLSLTMRFGLARTIYGTRAWRLGSVYILSSLVSLPLALKFPALLLIAGPLIFGYAHLLSSYRFSRQSESRPLFLGFTDVQTLICITVAGVGSRLLLDYFGYAPKLPFGFWEIAFVAMSVGALGYISQIASVARLTLTFAANGVLLYCAWQEPILFLGGTLIVHNWIAFVYWLVAAQGGREKIMCFACASVFAALHALTFFGFLDVWMPEEALRGTMPATLRATGWYLASWSPDPLVWYRLIVIYTFGLSTHYFVWLKAIPESGMAHEYPNTFRLSLEKLRVDAGNRALIFTLLVAFVTFGVYAVSTVWGARVYFAAAAMHGWFELSFLLLRTRRA